MKALTTSALCSLLALAACSKDNPYYCEGEPDNLCAADGAVGPMGCDKTADCTDSKAPVCDTTAHECVACDDGMTAACTGTTPVCSNQTCVACTSHGDCDSNVCLTTGACGNDTNVAYVTPNGNDTNPCSQAAPCQKITTAATKGKPYVKLSGTFDEAVLLDNLTVHIVADAGTVVTRSTVGPIIEVRGTSNVTIDDVMVRDAVGTTTGTGIFVSSGQPVTLTLNRVAILNNNARGLDIAGGSLTMSRCVVSGNNGGGAVLSSALDITNTLFVTNGSNTSTVGGLLVTPSGTNDVFRFNTVANNLSSTGTVTLRGLNCAVPLAVSNTIVSGNKASANCTFEYSMFDTGTNSTGTNKDGNPKFKATDATMPMLSTFFRIANDSDAINGGDPASTVTMDIDGDTRSMPDIGADEYK